MMIFIKLMSIKIANPNKYLIIKHLQRGNPPQGIKQEGKA